MQIQSLLKRKGGTKVTFEDANGKKTLYHFKPTDPNDPDSQHIAEVTNEAHINRFLTIPEGYRGVYKDGEEPAPITKPNPDHEKNPPADNAATVSKIRELSVRDLKASINTFSTKDLRDALTAEQASSDPRKSWVEVVQAQLGS